MKRPETKVIIYKPIRPELIPDEVYDRGCAVIYRAIMRRRAAEQEDKRKEADEK